MPDLTPKQLQKARERKRTGFFGMIFVIILLAIAFLEPDPTAFQYTVFRIVLALAAAAVATNLTGFLDVEVKGIVKAGGALAVFVVVFFFSPAGLVTEEPLAGSLDINGAEFLPLATDGTGDEGYNLTVEFVVSDLVADAGVRIEYSEAGGFESTLGKDEITNPAGGMHTRTFATMPKALYVRLVVDHPERDSLTSDSFEVKLR